MKVKSNLKKRIMSFALVLCIIVALIPAMPAEYVRAANTYTYKFDLVDANHDLVNGSSTATAPETALSGYNSFDAIKNIDGKDTGTGSWYISGASITKGPNSGTSFVRLKKGFIQQKIQQGDTGSIEIKIKVDEAGYYSATTSVAVFKDASDSRDDGESLPVDIKIGEKTNKVNVGSTDDKATEVSLGTYYLEANTEYAVVYSMTAKALQHIYMYNLMLTPVTSELSINDEELPKAMGIGSSADLPKVAENVTVGTSQYPVNVEFKSSNEEVISVGDGKITAKAAGAAKITMTATYDTDKTITADWGIVVREAATAGVISYRMDGQVHTTNGATRTFLRDLKSGTEYTDSVYETTWTYEGYTSDVTTHELRSDSGLGLKMKTGAESEGTITIKINVKKAGLYSVAVNVGFNDPSTTWAKFTVKDSGSNVLLSQKVNEKFDSSNVNVSTETELGTAYFPEEGWYTVEFYAHTAVSKVSTIWNWLKAVTLTEKTITKSDIFGSKYAYIQKAGDGTYTLYFVGGLNNINYAKAGFEINGDEDNVADTASVYASLSVNGTVYEASAYEAEHIFCAEKTGFEPGATVTIKPYVEDAQGKRTYHKYSGTEEDVEFTFTLPNA